MKKIISLDQGSSRIGWAYIEYNEHTAKGLTIDSGIRIFQEGVVDDNTRKKRDV